MRTVLIRYKYLNKYNSEGCSLTGQIISLLSRDHQFESRKPQGYWKFAWSLTSELMRLIEVRAS
jgi:hypothetical protein